jgi:hypothetical protein
MRIIRARTWSMDWEVGVKFDILGTGGESVDYMIKLRNRLDKKSEDFCKIIGGQDMPIGWFRKAYSEFGSNDLTYIAYDEIELASLEYALGELGVEIECWPKEKEPATLGG